MKAPFPITPEQTAIAIAYRNQSYIADEVLPRVTVGVSKFSWWQYVVSEAFSIPNTRVGRRSEPNQVEFNATEQTDSTEDFGLDDLVPQSDIDNAPRGHSPINQAVEGITDLILLDREKRAADIVFALATYPAANRVTLAGNDQWSDTANSDPIDDIQTGLDTPMVRPNIMVIGRQAFSKLAVHPKILKAVHGNAGDSGIARRAQLAELFELEAIYVGESRLNTAKKGQTPSYGRVWGKHCALHYRDRLATTQRGRVTFGITAQFGSRVAGTMPEPKKGLRGSHLVRAGESVKELVVSADAGYFIQNAIA